MKCTAFHPSDKTLSIPGGEKGTSAGHSTLHFKTSCLCCFTEFFYFHLVLPEKLLIVSSWGKLLLLVWNQGSQQELLERPQPAKNVHCSEWSVKIASRVPVPSPRGRGICIEFVLVVRWLTTDLWPELPCSHDPEEAHVDCQSLQVLAKLGTQMAELDCGCLLISPAKEVTLWALQSYKVRIIEILTFSFKKMSLKVSSAKLRPFCLGLNVFKSCHCHSPDDYTLVDFIYGCPIGKWVAGGLV